jgi:hypothetical protein
MDSRTSNPMSINQLVQAVLDENPGTEHTYVAQNHRVENERKRRYAAMIGLEVAKRMQQRAVVEPLTERVSTTARVIDKKWVSFDDYRRVAEAYERLTFGRPVSPPSADEVKHYEQRLRDVMRYTSHNPSCEYINKRQTRCSCGYSALAAIVLAEVGAPDSVSTKSVEQP